jgi:hypothetical protein
MNLENLSRLVMGFIEEQQGESLMINLYDIRKSFDCSTEAFYNAIRMLELDSQIVVFNVSNTAKYASITSKDERTSENVTFNN